MGKSAIDRSVEDRFWLGKYPPPDALAHLNMCDGCFQCVSLLETFGQCFICETVINKDHLYYDHPLGDYYCEDCVEDMPNKNTNEFVSCGACYERDIRENMVKCHHNFNTAWTCIECVSQSIINNRFEILDL